MDFHGFVSEAAGWTAALLTFLTFSMRSMRLLRIVALSANGCFILYGALAGLWPVLALHAALLPCNYLRLRELDAAGEDGREGRGGAGPVSSVEAYEIGSRASP